MWRSDVLVDELGSIWAAGSKDLLLKHGLVGSEANLIGYLVRNAGHIRVSRMEERSIARLVLYSGRIGANTITSALRLIQDWECDECHVEVLGLIPCLQVVRDFEELVALLVYHTGRECVLRRPKFYRSNLSLERLATESHLRHLGNMFEGWKKSHGVLEDIEADTRVFPPKQYYLAPVVRGRATFDVIADGYPTLKPLLNEALGACVSKQPDPVYGSWVAESVLEVAHYDEPLFETVEADVVLPAGDRVRSRYQRLLLPWVGHKGHVISCASVTLSTFRSAT